MVMIADGGGSVRVPVNVPNPVNPAQQPASSPESDAAARARELQRQLEALLEKLREAQRQAEAARQRAIDAQKQAQKVKDQAAAAETQAQKSKDLADINKAKKAQQDAKLEDARAKSASAEADLKEKDVTLLKAQVDQKKEQQKSPEAKASPDTDKKVQDAQTRRDDAKTTDDLSKLYLDSQEKESKAQDAEAKVVELTPPASKPQSIITDKERTDLSNAQATATKLRTEANTANTKFADAVGTDAQTEFYGSPPPSQTVTQPFPTVQATTPISTDPLHSPLLQLLQVQSRPQFPTSNNGLLLAPTTFPSTLTASSFGTTGTTPAAPLNSLFQPKPTVVTPEVTKTLSSIADGKTVDQIAKDRNIGADKVISEASASGIGIVSGLPDGDKQVTTVTKGGSSLSYTHDVKEKTVTVKGSIADPTAPGGKKTIDATEDSKGRYSHVTKDEKAGTTTTTTIDPQAGTRTESVVDKNGLRVDTTTSLTGAKITRPVGEREGYLDFAEAVGRTPEQLFTLNPTVDYGKPLKPGQELVVSDVTTTVKTYNKDGSTLERTVASDGTVQAVATTASGHRTVLEGKPDDKNGPGETARKAIFEDNKPLAEVAKSMGLTEDQVLAALPEGTVEVTKPTSDNGDVETRTMYDPITDRVVVESHDWQHDDINRQVINEKSTYTVHDTNPKTKQPVAVEKSGGLAYLQKQAENKAAFAASYDTQIADIDKNIRIYNHMGESTTDLRAERKALVDKQNAAKGEVTIAGAQYTAALTKNQQVVLDKQAAIAYQNHSYARPGSQEKADAATVLDIKLAALDNVDRLVDLANKDVTLAKTGLDKQINDTAKANADTNLQTEFQKWKDDVWMWQGIDKKTADKMKAEGQVPATRIFSDSKQENDVAWEAFVYQQKDMDKYGDEYLTPEELPARNAWLARNKTSDDAVASDLRYSDALSASTKAGVHLSQGDLDRLQQKKDAWVKANPTLFSENFKGPGEGEDQATLDVLRKNVTDGQIKDLQIGADKKYTQHLQGMSAADRADPEKMKEANEEYAKDNSESDAQLKVKIKHLSGQALDDRAQAVDAYIKDWEKRNPELKQKLDALGTDQDQRSVRAAEYRSDQIRSLLSASEQGQQRLSAMNMNYAVKGEQMGVGDNDSAQISKDLEGINQGIEKHTFVRDAWGAMWGDSADDAKDYTEDQLDKANQLRKDLAAGKISVSEYSTQEDALMDGYDVKSAELAQKVQDADGTWSVVDEAVRMTVTAAAGIAATIASGGNVAVGFGAAMLVSEVWDTTGDVVAAAQGRDIYADGHTSLWTLEAKAVTGNASWDDVKFTLKDEAIDAASNIVTATGVGAGIKTSATVSAKLLAKEAFVKSEGVLNIGGRAVVGARAGITSQAVDGVGRVTVESGRVGLDGKWGTEEGNKRIGATFVSSAAGLVTAPLTGGVSGAIPLWKVAPAAAANVDNAAASGATNAATNASTVTQKMSYAGFSGQFLTDGAGSIGTGELISYLNEGRGMNKGEFIAASLQALPGTLNNIALHPMMAARAKAKAQAANDAANQQPPTPTVPRGTPDVEPIAMAPVKIDAPVNDLPGLAGSDATTLKVGGVKLDDLTTGLDVQTRASDAMAPGGDVEFRVAIDTQKAVASAAEGVAASGAGNTRGKTAGTGKTPSESDNDGGVQRKGDETQETKDREEAQDAAIQVRMRAAGFDDIKIARQPGSEGQPPEIVVTATKPPKERLPGDPLARPAYDGYDQRMSYLSGSEMVALYGSGTRPDPAVVAADRAAARSSRIDMRLGATVRGRLNVSEYAPLASPTLQSVSTGIGTRSNLRAIATGAMDSIRFRSTVPIRDALGRELSVAVRPDEYRRTSMLQWGLSPMSRDTIFTVFAKDLIKTAKTELFGKEGTPGYGVNIRSAKDIGPAADGSGRVVELEISVKLDGEKVTLAPGEKDFFGGKASSSPDGHVKVPSSLMFDRVIEDFRIAPLLPVVKKLVGNPLPVTPSVERRSQMLLNDAVGAGDVVPTRFFEQFKKTFGDAKYRVQVVVPDRLPGFVRDPAAVAVRNFLANPDAAGFKALIKQGHVSGDPDKALFFVPNRGGNHHRTSVPGKPLTEAFTDLTGKQRRVPNESTSNVWVIFADNRLERTLQRGVYGVKKVVYGALPAGLQRSAPSPHHLVGTGNLLDAMTGGRGRPNADLSKRLTAVAALPTLFDVGVLGTSVEFRAQLGVKEPSAAKSVKKGQMQDFRVSPDDTRTVEVPKWFPKLLDRSLNGATPVVPKGGTEQLNTFLDKLQTHLSTEDGAALTALREKHMTGKEAAVGDGKFLRQPVAEDIVNLLAGLKPGAKPGSRPLLAGQPDEATPIAARPAPRPADLNYLEGEATVNGRPVSVRDIELAVPPDSILVMAERGNPPSAERIAADLRAAGHPEGKDVVLYLCEGGTPARADAPVPESLARELSNKIGARVHAVDGDIVLGAKTTVDGASVVQRPNLPLTDVSQKAPHPVTADADFDAQQRFWLEPGGRTQEAQAPFSQKVLDQGARVGDKAIDPLHLGIEDRVVDMRPMTAENAQEVFPLLVKQLGVSPEYNALGAEGMTNKWLGEIANGTRYARVIYPAPGSTPASDAPIGLISVHKEALIGDSYRNTLPPELYRGSKPAGQTSKEALQARGEVWQFSTYLGANKDRYPGGVINKAARMQFMKDVMRQEEAKGAPVEAFYSRVSGGAPFVTDSNGVTTLLKGHKFNVASSFSQESQTVGRGPIAVGYEDSSPFKSADYPDGEPARHIYIYETDASLYGPEGKGTLKWRSKIEEAFDKVPGSRGLLAPTRPADLNYLEGEATVKGQTVSARDIELAVPPDSILVMAERGNPPSAERIAADLRAKGYPEGKDVVLYLCEGGTPKQANAPVPETLARELSNKIGARVHAVDGDIVLGARNTVEGAPVVQRPNLPLTDVSQKTPHPVVADADFNAQQRFWLEPGGRTQEAQAPFSQKVLDQGATVGDKSIDPLHLGIKDDAAEPLPFNRAVELVPFDAQHARDVLPYLANELKYSPDYMQLGADGLAKKWIKEIEVDKTRLAYVIYPPPGSAAERRPIGIIAVHKDDLVGANYIETRDPAHYAGEVKAGALGEQELLARGKVWQFSTYLSEDRATSRTGKSPFPNGVVNSAAKKLVMDAALAELANRKEPIDAFYARVHAGAPKEVPTLGWDEIVNSKSLDSQARMAGGGPLAVVQERGPQLPNGETPTRYVAIFETPVGRYADDGPGTKTYHSLIDGQRRNDTRSYRWVGPAEWQGKPLVHRPANLNYLEGNATVNGRPVPARDIEVAVPEKAFVVMADEANVPSLERIAADMRAAGYANGQEVALYICRAGQTADPAAPVPQSLALQLSDKLGARVHAVEGTITLGEKTNLGEGHFVAAKPKLPLMDVSNGRTHANENFDAQQRYWLAPNGRGERVDAPLGAEVRNKGARVGDKPIDPLTLGIEDRAVELVRFDVQHARDVLPYLTHELRFSPEFTKLGAHEMAKKWTAEVQDGSRIAYVIYPAPGSNLARRPLGIISVHRGPLVSDSFIGIRPSESYPGAKPAGELSREALGDLGQVWQFSTYLSRARTSSKSAFPGGVVNTAAKKQLMEMAVKELAQKGEHIDAFYAAVHAGAPKDVLELGWPKDANVPSLKSQERMSGEGPITVVHQKAPPGTADVDGETPTRYIAIFKTPVGRYAEDGAGTTEYRSLLDSRIAADERPQRWLGPEEWQSQPLVHRRADLNYLEGDATVDGRPVPARDIEVAVPEKAFVVMADEANVPSAERIAADMRAAGYPEGQDVALYICRAGKLVDPQAPVPQSLALQLGEKLGARVHAMEGTITLGEKIELGKGDFVTARPQLPLMDVSSGRVHTGENFDTQQRFWLAPNGRGERVDAPLGAEVRNQGARVGEGNWIDPLVLGTTDLPQGTRAIDPDSVARESYDALARELGMTDSQADAMRGWTLAHRDAVTGFYDARLSNLKADTVSRTQARVAESGEDAHYVSAHMANLGGLNAAMNNVADAANVHFRGLTDILAAQLDATGGTVVPMRTGGKELGVAVVGIDEPTLANAVDATQRQVAQYAQDHDLADIPHPKHPGETGVGLRIGYTSVSPDKTLNHIFTEADQGVRRSNQHVTTDTGRAAGVDRPESGTTQATPAGTAAAGRRGAPAGEDGAGGTTRSATQSDTPHGLTAAALPTRYASGTHEHARIDPEAVRLQEFADAAHAAGLDARQFTGLRQYGHAPRDSVTGFYDARQSGVKADTVLRLQDQVANSDDNGFYVSADIANLSGLNQVMQSRAGGSNAHFKAMASLLADELASTGATVIPLRTGGDELAAAVVGRLDEAGLRTALDAAGQRIADYAQAEGLADIPHPKRAGEKGVGMHTGYAEALPGRTLDSIFTEADLGVDASKHAGARAAPLDIDWEGQPVVMRDAQYGYEIPVLRPMVREADGTRRPMTGTELLGMMGSEPLGTGAAGAVYPVGPGRVVKVFHPVDAYRNALTRDARDLLTQEIPDGARVDAALTVAHEEAEALWTFAGAAGPENVLNVRGPYLVGSRPVLFMDAYAASTNSLHVDRATRTFDGPEAAILNERSATQAGVISDRLKNARAHPWDPEFLIAQRGDVVLSDPGGPAGLSPTSSMPTDLFKEVVARVVRTGRQNAANREAPDTPAAGRVQFALGPEPEAVRRSGGLTGDLYDTVAQAKWAAIKDLPEPTRRTKVEPPHLYAVDSRGVEGMADGPGAVPIDAVISARALDRWGSFVPGTVERFRPAGGASENRQIPKDVMNLFDLGGTPKSNPLDGLNGGAPGGSGRGV